MSDRNVLYLGDTSLSGAAGYLAGLMTSWKLNFEYVPSDRPVEPEIVSRTRGLFILSDYPAGRLSPKASYALIEQVEDGAGLLMLGGWESFCGLGGDWAGTPVAEALPVEVATSDDRVNCDQPALIGQVADHPVTRGLPWSERPPTIGGFNQVTPKAGAQVLLETQRFTVRVEDGVFQFAPSERSPLLVVGTRGQGRTAALMTDVAPHWVGGLVDWGAGRVVAQATGADAIEVGDQYAAFFRQLLFWTGQLG